MNWRTKGLLQVAFSRMPYGERLNYLGQRHLLRNLPVDDTKLTGKVEQAQRHLAALRRHGPVPVEDACFYEFGAGRDLIIPLAFYGLGVNRQVLVDIRRMVRVELVNDAIRRLGSLDTGLLRGPQELSAEDDLDAQLSGAGIEYRAPSDARSTGVPPGSVDYVTSTSTLEHIPTEDIRSILQECRRILRPQGLMSLSIDYQDHYSYTDSSVSAYNFLRFDDRRWAFWSPSLQFQNRLRHVDHLRLLQEEGFEVVLDEPRAGQPEDLDQIRRLPLAARFRSYTTEELAVHDALIVVRAE